MKLGIISQTEPETLFNVPLILNRLGVDTGLRDVVELGCGFGTFTIPVARRIAGVLTTVDIDATMVERTRQRASAARIHNVVCTVRDVFADGFGCEAGSQDACLLFNILHRERDYVRHSAFDGQCLRERTSHSHTDERFSRASTRLPTGECGYRQKSAASRALMRSQRSTDPLGPCESRNPPTSSRARQYPAAVRSTHVESRRSCPGEAHGQDRAAPTRNQ
jgi:SAM-dependent methyltransferase